MIRLIAANKTYEEIDQLWITLRIGTDIVPLLVNLCSEECEKQLPKPPQNYVPHAHKGGAYLTQPPDENELWEKEWEKRKSQSNIEEEDSSDNTPNEKIDIKDLKPLKLIRKLWDKD